MEFHLPFVSEGEEMTCGASCRIAGLKLKKKKQKLTVPG